jgi:hypothetical protein
MVEGSHRIHHGPTINHAQARAMSRAVRVLAIREAIKAVKQRMQAQGLKVQHFQHKVILAAADEYLTNHRSELVWKQQRNRRALAHRGSFWTARWDPQPFIK